MALVKGTNSYRTVDDANETFSQRLDAAAWTQDATADQKAAALITSTMLIDLEEYIGYAVSESQDLAFPRVGAYYEPKLGTTVTLTETTPWRIERACDELAYHLLNNDGLLDDVGGVKSISLAQIDLQGIRNPSKFPSIVKSLLKPLLVRGGSTAWWRSN